ncbi:putative PDZ domain-containing protein PDZK1P1 [Synchiropus splendidus]|uniref:putative PDZ domain-containing protein PDZK1P1 n=1 Tax=Synchiropus splendidus TaxID=270530 RepID=UPI00237D5959|nr:putative PDZ domain-containing protein PDZK1P1 [Synchiropus splendidus]
MMVTYHRSGGPSMVVRYPRSGGPSMVVRYPRSGGPSMVVRYPRSGGPSMVVRYPRSGGPSMVVRYPRSGGVRMMVRFTFNARDGIDNPVLVVGDDPDPNPMPRLCQLKRVEGQNFGFNLRLDRDGRGLEVWRVERWTPADYSGLKDGDRILEINAEHVAAMDVNKVVRKIQSSGLYLFLLVLRAEEYKQAMHSGLDLCMLASAYNGFPCFRPRLCHINRDSQHGLGLTAMSVKGVKGQHILSTVASGPAEKAGVQSGDKLIWINGVMASKLKRSNLRRILRKSREVTVLVIDHESESSYIRKKMPILPELAQCGSLPHSAKTMHLQKGPDGYGFLLRQEKLNVTHQLVHILREVEVGSPAEGAGLEDGNLLLAVNGVPVETMEHEEIVTMIRLSGNRVSLTCISILGRAFFRKLGLSPLWFHEEFLVQDLPTH